MLAVLERKILPDFENENPDIVEIVNMNHIYKKCNVNEVAKRASHFATQVTQDPIISQSSRPSKDVPSNTRYNQLNSIFQRFSARATRASQAEYNKILESFTKMTEMSEQNHTNQYYDFFQNLDESMELPNIEWHPNRDQIIDQTPRPQVKLRPAQLHLN